MPASLKIFGTIQILFFMALPQLLVSFCYLRMALDSFRRFFSAASQP